MICLLALWIDSYVEILGDGQRDLLKHLFIPNILFDLSGLAILNAVLAGSRTRSARKDL